MTQYSPSPLTSDGHLPSLLISALSHWAVISLTDQEQDTYLQGQVTCDVKALANSDWTWGGHCDAKGKLWSSFRLFRNETALMMLVRQSVVAQQLPELRKYAAFSKVSIDDTSEQWRLFGISGELASTWLSSQFGDAAVHQRGTLLEHGFLLKETTPSSRWILALQASHADAILKTLPAEASITDGSAWDALDILACDPVVEGTNSNQFLPQMINLQAVDGISFDKGCYMGQEMVARAKYRGINKRAMYLLKGRSDHNPQPGDDIELQLDAADDSWRRSGTVLSAYRYQDGSQILLAVLPKYLEANAVLRFKAEEHSRLAIQPRPYSLDE